MQTWAKTKVQCLVRNNHSGIYYARARVCGKLLWKTLDTDQLIVAKARLPKVLLDLGRGSKSSGRLTGSGIVTFGDAAAARFAIIETRVDIKSATKHYWRQIVKALLASWPNLADRKLAKITDTDAREWAAAYQEQVSPTRFNNSVDCVKSIFALGVKEGVLFQNPAAELGKAKLRAKKLELLSREHFDALVASVRGAGAWCSKQCGDLIEFLAYSGCRLDEAKHVRWSDVEADSIWIHGGSTGTKNWKSRQVPVIAPMRTLLNDLKANPRYCRGDRERYVMAICECQKAIDTACAELKIKRFTHHTLRHLFCTRVIESGVDFLTLSKCIGHSDGGSLLARTYAHLRFEHSVEMAKKVTF